MRLRRGGIRRTVERVLRDSGLSDCEVSVLLTGDSEIQELNRKYRKIDRPTDVLGFPMNDPYMLGDVVISIDRAAEQAACYGVSVEGEVMRLLVHGTLHLLGYDHARGGRQAAKMKRKEEELLGGLYSEEVL